MKGDLGIISQGITCKTGAGITYQELLDAPIPVAYLTDAVGTQHRIDYAGRRKDWLRLGGWARGEGSQQQYRYGQLAQTYGMLHGGYHTAPVLARYLGITEDLAGRLLALRKLPVNQGEGQPEETVEQTIVCFRAHRNPVKYGQEQAGGNSWADPPMPPRGRGG